MQATTSNRTKKFVKLFFTVNICRGIGSADQLAGDRREKVQDGCPEDTAQNHHTLGGAPADHSHGRNRVDHQPPQVNCVTFPILSSTMWRGKCFNVYSDPDAQLRRMATETLANLAKYKKARRLVRKYGGISKLVDLLDVDNPKHE